MWHQPMQFYRPPRGYKHCSYSPYKGQDVFVVVRNPYERAISAYLYFCKTHRKHKCHRQPITPETMNENLIARLQRWTTAGNDDISQDSRVHQHFCYHDMPQYHYVFSVQPPNNLNATEKSMTMPKRIVDWVLHLEDFPGAFDSLMDRYHLGVHLPVQKVNARDVLEGPKDVVVEDLSREAMDLINQIYKLDFEEFGYPMR